MGLNVDTMKQKFGEILGLFAYAHPFLDGNGRTMLLVHLELAYRAGFCIAWDKTDKNEYLDNLTKEIAKPNCGILDLYLSQFVTPLVSRNLYSANILKIKGLNGINDNNYIINNNKEIEEKYLKLELSRNYKYSELDVKTIKGDSLINNEDPFNYG